MIVVTVGLVLLIVGESPVDSNGLYATAVGQQRLIALSDGSNVNLNTDSQIRVNFGEAYRDVYLLRGEAHFAVADDREVPFRVSAGSGRIRALGTAFSVYVRDGSVDVTVSEGTVRARKNRSGRDAARIRCDCTGSCCRTIRARAGDSQCRTGSDHSEPGRHCRPDGTFEQLRQYRASGNAEATVLDRWRITFFGRGA